MAKWGTNWHTPTRGQMEELIDKCTWEWTQVTGTHGYRVTGPNGNSIFLPAGGYREGESRRWLENAGWYWTKTREDSLFGMRYFSLLFLFLVFYKKNLEIDGKRLPLQRSNFELFKFSRLEKTIANNNFKG